LGKTSSKNPHLYKGSGTYWNNHIKHHGYDVTTEILKECDTNDEIAYWGKFYSELWDVVNSKNWANLKPEHGDGGSWICTEEHRLANSERNSGSNNPFYGKKHSEETKQKMKHNQPDKRGDKNPNWRDGISKLREHKKFECEYDRSRASSERMKVQNPMFDEEIRNKHIQSIAEMREKKSILCVHCNKMMDPGGYAVHFRSILKKGLI
jgi:hypothetical protein